MQSDIRTTCIVGDTLNELILNACQSISANGKPVPSRYGQCTELHNVDLVLTDPQERYLWLKGRKNNIFGTVAEILWVLAGHDNIDPFLSFFVPRASQFSDNGRTWHDAYGPRLYANHQFGHIVKMFQREGLGTRRAVMSIWDATKDTYDNIPPEQRSTLRALPCNNMIWVWVQGNKFHMKVAQRSADLIWGVSNINIPEFTCLQEYMLTWLKKKLPDLFGGVYLGEYMHSVVNLHVYDKTSKQVDSILQHREENLDRCSSVLGQNNPTFHLGLEDLDNFSRDGIELSRPVDLLVRSLTGKILGEKNSDPFESYVRHEYSRLCIHMGWSNVLCLYAAMCKDYIEWKLSGEKVKWNWKPYCPVSLREAIRHTPEQFQPYEEIDLK